MIAPAWPSSRKIARTAFESSSVASGWRQVPEEVPIAFSFYGTTHAVMMATPADLEDFATGFCLSEGIVGSAIEIETINIVPVTDGIDLQVTLAADARARLKVRRRQMAGPVGCGLCGIESIEEVMRPLPSLGRATPSFTAEDITRAAALLARQQPMNDQTRAMHAAGFYTPGGGVIAAREDVGRHNALDKLAGHLARNGHVGSTGAVVVTSRVSVEMVQKTAIIGAPLLIAISAPTALALDVAERAGLSVAALVRGDSFELFTHPGRIRNGQPIHVA
ncbi:formate dehydrogenase accessory sulfurtransferase FdhD [Mariluticola halotolerans]|uniref:formate dehydrogenase accessory sulfurtransferase FdhD n=1 Tax=Mariluticola halotolerans TaxID=2909283 RepID=UPI0026E17621|nr:formate dehydrogenase accessory sulfurtransferase FdhD [Mariluticola halotolerans]UJQ92978.1 formate dehydrogenase accessory sulfurtransferase FdhD [Mariluticola halotolerans]